ncbi:hypothetical protein ACSTDZ_08665 [Vibrio vulnificus]|uniref:hypothetical protein n=1 Tax=Vibrio TaxID=662 RepID=UPI000A5E3C5C|nr:MULTISPECIES: hypothetical protein [Vibrio]EGQ8174599.1 hypothetical protein [Vibrio vulnificus]EGQ9759494.1 hypothetical protein [Vibrio parahaemolyticus]EHK3079705.1 hypothetical protein [Vibrio parahaemolyticus]EJI1277396.1 hypothetical protein [Vibrio vulnificus]EJM7151487.1 hypothetical protein [Vibrio parahaemolyticus]
MVLWKHPSEKDAVIRLIKKLIKFHGTILVCYEAGPKGYGLYRLLLSMNIECTVDALLIEWPVDLVELSALRLMGDYTSQLSLSALFSLVSQSNSDGLKIVHQV